MRAKSLIIDLDDTLCNTFGDLVFNAHLDASKAMVDAGFHMSVEQTFKERIRILEKTISNNFSKSFEDVLKKEVGCSAEELEAGFDAYYNRDIKDITLFPLAKKFLNMCSSLKIALVTKGHKETQLKKIKKLNIEKYFDYVSVVNISNSKEEEFKKIMIKWEVDPGEVVVLGDRPDSDIYPGNKLNMVTVRYKSEHYMKMKPRNDLEISDYEVESYRDLISLFEKNFI